MDVTNQLQLAAITQRQLHLRELKRSLEESAATSNQHAISLQKQISELQAEIARLREAATKTSSQPTITIKCPHCGGVLPTRGASICLHCARQLYWFAGKAFGKESTAQKAKLAKQIERDRIESIHAAKRVQKELADKQRDAIRDSHRRVFVDCLNDLELPTDGSVRYLVRAECGDLLINMRVEWSRRWVPWFVAVARAGGWAGASFERIDITRESTPGIFWGQREGKVIEASLWCRPRICIASPVTDEILGSFRKRNHEDSLAPYRWKCFVRQTSDSAERSVTDNEHGCIGHLCISNMRLPNKSIGEAIGYVDVAASHQALSAFQAVRVDSNGRPRTPVVILGVERC